MVKIAFWTKESGNLLSHGEGLTEEQVKALHQLTIGDRLILWKNTVDEVRTSTYTLKKFEKREDR